MLTVVAIAPAAHAADDAARVEEVLVVPARVRAALVGVMQEPEVGAPALQGHLKRVRLEFPILSLNPGLRQRCMAPDVWPTLSRA